MSTASDLLITKEQFNEAIIKFIHRYERLPYQPEDDIEVEIKNDEDELELKNYRANKYVKEFYKTQDKMSEELLNNNIITYKMISDITKISETVLKNAIEKTTKNPDLETRKAVHVFFNNDYYKELGIYAKKCEDCQGCKCKYDYFVSVVYCPKFKKKETKAKKK